MTMVLEGRRQLVIVVLACLVVGFAGAPASAAGPVITLRAGASEAQGTTVPAMALARFCELAAKLSNGQLNVQPFYQSLGIEQQLAEAVKAGSVDIGYTSTSNLARFTDAFLEFDLPFLFKNDKAYINVLENYPFGKKAIAQFEKDLGVKVLMITSHAYDAEVNGTGLVTRNKPVMVPADIQGLKLRTMSTPVEINLIKAFGGNPTPVDYAQVYSALQQGVVDGLGGMYLSPFVSLKLYEVSKYYVALDLRNILVLVYMNQQKFNSLTPFQQKALLEAAAQTEPLAGQFARDLVKTATATVEKNGVRIIHPTKDQLARWLSVREGVWQQSAKEFKDKIDLQVAKDIYELNQR